MPRHWDHGLVGPARRIAEIDHSPLRVVAGPGTGKTFALIRRAARLLREGAPPHRILACTFTRTAARDLRRELSQLGITGANRVHAGTIHALCFGILSKAEVLEITGRSPRPLLDFEIRFLLQDLSSDQLGGIRDLGKRLHAFNAAWARLQSDEPGWPIDPIDRNFHTALLSWLIFHQAMLIGELVPETLRYLRNNPLSPDRRAYDHVLVDEYQDLNRAEQEVLDLLATVASLSVVGDEDQSIYSFKFAHPDGIATFDQTHPDTHDEVLSECRRCPTLIVEMANTLISHNRIRQPRQLCCCEQNPAGEALVVQWRNYEEEAEGVAEFIRQRIADGSVDAGRVLVLSPRRQFGYAVRDALTRKAVNAHSFFYEEALDGNPKNYSNCHAQMAFTLLTLLANQNDRVALRCWSGFGSPTLRKAGWSVLIRYCEDTGDAPYEILHRLSAGELSIRGTQQLVERFNHLQDLLNNLRGLSGQNLVDALFPVNQAWAVSLRILTGRLDENDFDAEALRDSLRVSITQPELPTDVEYVRIMSLHKSKGLTADLVVIVVCIDGLIPLVEGDTAAERDRSLEEQRRLFYVAVTRTTNTLVLSSVAELPRDLAHRIGARVRGGTGRNANTIASRFLSELGPILPASVRGDTIW